MMAKSSVYSELLSTNLELLFMNHPPSVELQELLRKNLFLVPNKSASDELICYLYAIIDEKKYNSLKQLWLHMMLDKKIENNFYSLVHKFSKEISDEYPEENLPKVAKSFFLTPSGERYVQYLYKLTLIAMKNDLKATGIVVHPARRQKDEAELSKLETMKDMLDQHLKAQTKTAEQLHADNKSRERLLKSQIEKNQKLLTKLTTDLKMMMEKCSLPEYMKSFSFSEHDQKVIKEWSTVLSQRCWKLEENAEVIQNVKWNISQLNNTIAQKRNRTLSKCSSHLRNEELVNGLFPEDFLNNLLRQAEETLNAQRLEGPANLSQYIPDLQDLANQFQDLLSIVSQCSQLIIQLHDETEAQMPRMQAILFTDDQLDVKNIEEEATALINKMCESTPPEMLRNLRIAELKCSPLMKNYEMESQNGSRMDAVCEEDTEGVAESCTPVPLLKPVFFERICSGSTWKHNLLLSTLKKKRPQNENSISDSENGMYSPECLTDTPRSQVKRTSNPVKSLNILWTDDSENCRNFCLSKEMPHGEVPSYNHTPEKSNITVNSAISNPVRTVCHLSSLPDSRLGSGRINHIFPGLLQPSSGTSNPEKVKHLIIQEQKEVSDLTFHHRPSGRHSSEEDNTRISEACNSGNLSKELHNFIQAVTNSNGSLMGASSVFESSASPSPTGSTMAGIQLLEQTSLDFMHSPSLGDTSLVHWDDQKDVKRILSVVFSPVGISPAEVRSSTPINSNSSSQPEQNGHLKESEAALKPPAAAHAVSRIPRIKSLGQLRLK